MLGWWGRRCHATVCLVTRSTPRHGWNPTDCVSLHIRKPYSTSQSRVCISRSHTAQASQECIIIKKPYSTSQSRVHNYQEAIQHKPVQSLHNYQEAIQHKPVKRGRNSSVGRASDSKTQVNTDAGSSPRYSKRFFCQSELRVQTLLRCPYICAHVKKSYILATV